MRLADIRYLFGYDRWATTRILAVVDGVVDGVDGAAWGAAGAVGERGLGAILAHDLGRRGSDAGTAVDWRPAIRHRLRREVEGGSAPRRPWEV